MEWTVVTVFIALFGLFAAVGAPIARLIQSITKLTITLNVVSTKLEDTVKHNKCQDMVIQDHEKRITVIENTTTENH